MKAIATLMDEHLGIGTMLDVMSAISKKIQDHETIEGRHLDDIVDFLSGFADRCHHSKEENILFARMRDTNNPVFELLLPELLAEHESGRNLIKSLRHNLISHKQGNNDSLPLIGKLFSEYTDLIKEHILKENMLLFPALEEVIHSALDKEIVSAFDKLENEVIGAGQHEAYHKMLDKFSQLYIK